MFGKTYRVYTHHKYTTSDPPDAAHHAPESNSFKHHEHEGTP